jgi:hypothetical protein
MKRTIYFVMALALLLALVPTTVFAHAANDPYSVDLLAGQTEDIGDVKVWNDGENLYVQFVYEGPDCGFLEVHLQVDEGDWYEGILTKKGSPIPGQFEASYKPGWCFKTHTFTFNLVDEGFLVGDELMIAAHAALGREMTMSVASAGDTATVYGPIDHYAVIADSSWGTGKLAPETEDHPYWAIVPGAAWISSYAGLYPEGWSENAYVPDSWRWFHHEFSVPGPVKEAMLMANADNAEEIYVNSLLVATDGEVQGAIVPSDEWGYVEDVGYVDVQEGMNALDFIVRNYPATSAGQRNPTALAYKLDVTYYLGGDSAWGAGTRFVDKGNWATYFTYTVQEPCPYEPGLVNGGFEAPAITGQPWDIFDSGTEGLGWTVEWYGDYQGAPDPAHLEIHTSGTVVTTPDGGQYAELDTDWDGYQGGLNGEPASVKIYQTLDTCPGQTYTLSYAWRGRPNYASQMQVNFADYTDSHSDNSGQWNVVEVTATATDWTTTLEFIETGPADSFGMFLDAVSVTKCDGSCP